MGQTTFSGPIKAGPVSKTTGTNVQTNMKDVGSSVISQSVSVTQNTNAPATTIIIPANSQIISIKLYVTVAWSGGASTAGLGWDNGAVVDATSLTTAAGVAGGTLGIVNVAPGANKPRVDNWLDSGTDKKRIRLLSANAGNGVGVLTVDYVQNNNTL